jgi:ubiquinol-cytochrome c reductase iron-sulfur subunit
LRPPALVPLVVLQPSFRLSVLFSLPRRPRPRAQPLRRIFLALKPGEKMTVEWRGKPVWIVRRTPEQLAALPKLNDQLADPKSERKPAEQAPNTPAMKPVRANPNIWWWWAFARIWAARLRTNSRPGPQPSLPDDWQGGFFCPCHGSTFDLAGRVYKNKPAPDNLEVPPHMYLSDTKLLIGDDKKA